MNNWKEVETYCKTGILSQDGYNTLCNHAYAYFIRHDYSTTLTAHDLVTSVLPSLINWDKSKSSVKTYATLCLRSKFNNRHRKKTIVFVNHEIDFAESEDKGGEDKGSMYDLYSFDKYNERNHSPIHDTEFLKICLSWWLFAGVDRFFRRGTSYNDSARRIIYRLIDFKDYQYSPKGYSRFVKRELGLNTRQSYCNVINKMVRVNKRLYSNWLEKGTLE